MRVWPYILAVCVLAALDSASAKDKSCSALQTDYGYVCVCNSTYCDTISAPTTLKSGKYHHYSTSASTPGFTLKNGKFGTTEEKPSLVGSSSVKVTVDSSTTYQTFVGVGAGFSDSAAYVYSQVPTKVQENIIASFFGSESIELNFARVPIGDTDFSLNYYSYDATVGDVNMTDFALTDFETGTKMPFIQAAVEASERTLNLLATPWTSPPWMKDNNNTEPGVLIPEYHEAFSKYIVKFLDAYKEDGIDFWGLSPMNEPIFGVAVGFSMPNVVILPTQYRAWLRDYLGPMLLDAGYDDLQILALDDERPYLTWYGDRLMSDNETAQYIDGFAVHWYSDSNDNTAIADTFHENYPDVYLIMTEASGIDGMVHSKNNGRSNVGGSLSATTRSGPQPPNPSGGSFTGGPGPNPSGGSFTGGPGPNPSGGSFTGGPGPNPSGGSFTGGPGPNPSGGSFTGGPGPNPTGGGGGGNSIELGSWDYAVTYIDDLIQQYQHWSAGFMSWNLCLNTEGGPYLQMSQEAPVLVNLTTNVFYKQPFYYALGHFSKFIYPDSVRIGLTVESSSSIVQPKSPATTASPSSSSFDGIATTNPDGSTSVILFNPSSAAVTVEITDTEAGTITTTVEANSLNTFIYW